MNDAMSVEFDTLAEWTARVAVDLGPSYYIPAACRGSGSPAALDWLIDALDLTDGESLLDCGAGVGGPAAYAQQQRSVRPVLVEPAAGACRAARTLFGSAALQAAADALPVADQSFDAAWSLGVLCTMDDQLALLTELRRAVRPPGRIGLLVFVAGTAIADSDQPDGNHFPTAASLEQLITDAGLRIDRRHSTADLPAIPDEWTRQTDAVTEALHRRYDRDPGWKVIEEQQDRMSQLLGAGTISGSLLNLRVE